ncbi:hypothetical protein T484DRAFT_3639585, partial [Baffinella frigidus]
KFGTRSPEPGIRNSEPGARNPKFGTRNPEPENRKPKPGTRGPNPETLSPTPDTRNPKPETRNPKPETRNPKPETLTPKPETRSRGRAGGWHLLLRRACRFLPPPPGLLMSTGFLMSTCRHWMRLLPPPLCQPLTVGYTTPNRGVRGTQPPVIPSPPPPPSLDQRSCVDFFLGGGRH